MKQTNRSFINLQPMEQTMPSGDYMKHCYNFSENTSDYYGFNSTGQKEFRTSYEFNTYRPKSTVKKESVRKDQQNFSYRPKTPNRLLENMEIDEILEKNRLMN
jgi:hypothetical protein